MGMPRPNKAGVDVLVKYRCGSLNVSTMIKMMLLAGVGGFAGTCGRFLIGRLGAAVFHGSFPLGTFLVNVTGCFVIGLLYGLLDRTNVLSPGENMLLVTGFCGGFTTFSTFANDMWVLGGKGEWMTCLLYLLASVIVGVVMVWAGRMLTR